MRSVAAVCSTARAHCSRWSVVGRELTTEASLVAYYEQRQSSGRLPVSHALAHPVLSALAVVAVLRLPVLEARLLADPESAAVRRTLMARTWGLPLARTGVAVLEVPDDPADNLAGPHKQTLRRKVRSATRAGITTHRITDTTERRHLLEQARLQEVAHPDPRYRTAVPDVGDLDDYALWLVARSAGGAPLLLCVTPVAGAWATLRYFRTLGSGPEHSDSRYLMTQALVEGLAALGVRHLADTSHPAALTPGLRHFQRMLGFRLRRVAVEFRGPVSRRPPAALESDDTPAGAGIQAVLRRSGRRGGDHGVIDPSHRDRAERTGGRAWCPLTSGHIAASAPAAGQPSGGPCSSPSPPWCSP